MIDRKLTDKDDDRYAVLQEKQQKVWESLCHRCGACCGAATDDPCSHLKKDVLGKYFCEIYENRFGLRKTVKGREFRCVPIRNILHESWPGDHQCGYKQWLRENKNFQI